jgi:heme exporter protein C
MKSIWRWFHKWTSPKWFYQMSEAWLPWLTGLAFILIPVAVIWGLAFAPPDYQQGNSFRIFYIHLPAAILAQSVFIFMAVAGLVSLVWRIKLADIFIKVAAPFGAAVTLLALLTGAIWGKPTWGTWWVWDARLTSTLIQFFLYLGVIAIFSAMETVESAGRAASLTCLVGVVNVPIIKFSVEWWNTLHQPATFSLTEKPSMPMEMWLPALIAVIGFYCLFGAVTFYKMQSEIIYRERRSLWVQERFNSDTPQLGGGEKV